MQRISGDRCPFINVDSSQKEDLSRLATKLEYAASLSVDKAASKHAPEDHIPLFMNRFATDCTRPCGRRLYCPTGRAGAAVAAGT